MKHVLAYGNREFEVRLLCRDPLRIEIREGEQRRELEWPDSVHGHSGRMEINGATHGYWVTPASKGIWVTVGGETFFIERVQGLGRPHDAVPSDFAAPMPGKIISVKIEAGASVEKGQVLVLMEAMKMEHRIEAPCSGTVTGVFCAEGELVEQGTQLLEFESVEE